MQFELPRASPRDAKSPKRLGTMEQRTHLHVPKMLGRYGAAMQHKKIKTLRATAALLALLHRLAVSWPYTSNIAFVALAFVLVLPLCRPCCLCRPCVGPCVALDSKFCSHLHVPKMHGCYGAAMQHEKT